VNSYAGLRSQRLLRVAAAAFAVSACLAAAACGGNESAFQPGGPQAGRINSLWWYMFWVAAAVWVLVIAFLGIALQRARKQRDDQPEEEKDRAMKKGVVIATVITVLILIVNLVYSVTTGSAMAALPRKDALRIDVEGKQWWWQVTYEDPTPGNQVVTANEIHVPVGEPIQIIGTSHDVIHSFWAPNLFGKKDLIPGHTTATWFQADTPGVYRGQCAEFCGHQHAKMAVLIVAEPRSKFEEWYKTQQLPAAPPSDSLTRAGEAVFMSRGCPVCHTVGGTRALGTIGPNLTHIGSSLTIAAGSLPNTRGNLAGWIIDPQQIKPGVRMPPNDLSGPELQAILAYLENLR
jgi:cytochrome c oxidase subunit 2